MNIIFFISLLLLTSQVQAHQFCDHDSLEKPWSPSEDQHREYWKKNKHRKLAAKQQIRITSDFTRIAALPTVLKDHIIQQFEVAKLFYSKLLKVDPVAGNNIFPSGFNTCGTEVTVDSNDQTVGIANSDIHFYVTYKNDGGSSVIAQAGACVLSAGLERPIFARVIYNLANFQYTAGDKYQFEKNLETTLHELMHALGFSNGVYDKYKDSGGNYYPSSMYTTQFTVTGQLTTFIQTPQVTQTARDYYGCPTLEGMPLENEGGAGSKGSHWERTAIYNDMMGASATFGRAYFTIFDAALMKDTGWYEVNDSMADNVEWGRGKGCNFIYQGCSNPQSEFCNAGDTDSCDTLGTGGGPCSSDTFSTSCKYFQNYSNYQCKKVGTTFSFPQQNYYFNWDSRCFSSSLFKSASTISSVLGCYKTECTDNGTKIKISISTETIICDTNSAVKTLSGYTGQLTCPSDISKFCKVDYGCMDFCSENGYCNNKICVCLQNYYGPGCQCHNQFYYNGTCVVTCPAGYQGDSQNICQQIQCAENDNVYNCKTCTGALCTVCADQFYPDSGVCKQCISNCKTCTNNSDCSKCITGFVLQGQLCKASCDPTFYADANSVCQSCFTNCKSCSGSSTCSECNSTYYLYSSNTQCVSSCPANYFVDGLQCSQCHPNCDGCSTGANNTNCTQCKAGKFLKSGACVDACDTNQYITGSQCQDCQTGCLTCTNNTNCTNCGALKNQGGLCKSGCDANYYADASNICQLCDSSCSSCSGPFSNQCLICSGGKKIYNNQCYSSCPINTFLDSDGVTCKDCDISCNGCSGIGDTHCTSCATNYFKLGVACKSSCNSNQYVSSNVCMDCDTNCLTCTGVGSCTQCAASYVNQTGNCKMICDDGFYNNGGICQNCASNCKTCNDSSSNQCTSCIGTFKFYKNTCIALCDGNRYLSSDLTNCLDCNVSCNGCTNGNTNADCSACAVSYFIQNGKCVNTCPSSQYFNGTVCVNCDNGCLECTGSSHCSQCNAGLKNQSGVCKANCDSGWNFDSQNNCYQCYNGCQTCFGKNNNQCSTCITGYKFFSNQCFSSCPSNTFTQSDSCIQCDLSCNECTGQGNAKCIQCSLSYYQNGSNCVSACSIGQYPDSQRICQPCMNGCQQCTQANICQVCYSSYANQDGICQDDCNINYFKSSDGTCKKCATNCTQCSGELATNCTGCASTHYLYNYQCHASQCPNGSYQFGLQNICLQCDQSCLTCTGSGNSSCKICNSSYYKNQAQCVLDCNHNQYKDETNKQCKDCITGCSECTNGTTCITCNSDHVNMNGICKSSCDINYYTPNSSNVCKKCSANCSTCVSSNMFDCTSCYNSTSFYNNQCLPSCPNGYFSSNSICQECDFSCETCTTSTSLGCTNCRQGYKKDSQNRCISQCNPGYFLDPALYCKKCGSNCYACSNELNCATCNVGYKRQGVVCQLDCDKGYFSNSNNVCQQCSVGCLTCEGPQSNQCLSCIDGYSGYNKSCVQKCPQNTYQKIDASSGLSQCVACDKSCNGCTADTNSYCITCSIGYIMISGMCVPQCNNGYFLNSSGQCQQCYYTCSKCTSLLECQECQDPYIKEESTCVSQCSPGYYLESSGVCLKCDSTCLTCSGPNFNQCLNCPASKKKYKNTCVSTCSLNTYVSNNECFDCHYSCNGCLNSSQQQCISCASGFVFDAQNYCKPVCGDKKYKDSNGNCQNCIQNCDACSLAEKCIVCTNGYYYDPILKVCSNSCSLQYYPNYSSKKCEGCSLNCLACTGPTSSECTQCLQGYQYKFGKCVANICSSSQYLSDSLTCKNCDSSCKTCTGSLNSNCLECNDQYFFNQRNECVYICDSNQIKVFNSSLNTYQCLTCPDNCYDCKQVNGLAVCQVCLANFYKYQNTCTQNCPLGYYGNSQKECQKCLDNCIQCQSGSTCIQCQDNYSFRDGACLKTECKAGFFWNGTFCQSCIPNCSSCKNGITCESCQQSYKYNGVSCVLNSDNINNCVAGQYFDTLSQLCKQCPSNCPKCTSLTDCSTDNGTIETYQNKCHFTCNTCAGSEFNQCLSCVENRVLNVYSSNNSAGECNCPSNTTDKFERACSNSVSAKQQKYLQISTVSISATTSVLTGFLAFQSPFVLSMTDFSQVVGYLSYLKRKNSMQFDENTSPLRKMNINYLIKSPFNDNDKQSSSKRLLQQNYDGTSQNKIQELHGSNSFLVTCFTIFLFNCIAIVFMVVMRLLPPKNNKISDEDNNTSCWDTICNYCKLMLPSVVLMLTVQEMSLCIFLQFFKYADSNSNYRVSGLVLSIFSFVYVIGFIAYQIYLSVTSTQDKIDTNKPLVFYFSLLKKSNFLTRSHYILITIKKILCSFFIVSMYDHPIMTISFLFSVEIIMLFYISIVKPFKENWVNIISIISSFGLTLIHLIFLIMTATDQNSSDTQTQCIVAIIIITNILLIFYAVFTIFAGLRALRSLLYGSKTVASESNIINNQVYQPNSSINQNYGNQSLYLDEKYMIDRSYRKNINNSNISSTQDLTKLQYQQYDQKLKNPIAQNPLQDGMPKKYQNHYLQQYEQKQLPSGLIIKQSPNKSKQQDIYNQQNFIPFDSQFTNNQAGKYQQQQLQQQQFPVKQLVKIPMQTQNRMTNLPNKEILNNNLQQRNHPLSNISYSKPIDQKVVQENIRLQKYKEDYF